MSSSHQPVYRMSSGLVHLTRLHSIRSQSVASILSTTSEVSSNFNACEDKSWSWKHLRSEFKAKDAEKLFEKYQARLQHNFFMVLLMLNVFFNTVAIIVYFLDESPNIFPGPVVMRVAGLTVYISFFVLTCLEEKWLRPKFARIVAAVTVLIAMLFSEHGGALYSLAGDDTTFSMQRIRPTYYLILTNNVFLPFPSRIYGCVATLVIVVIELTLTVTTRLSSDCPVSAVYRYAIADFIFYSVSAIIGFVLTFLLEIANRRAFLDHRRCVQSKFKLNYEKEQQDQLLNSCIPKHLAERVRNDIRDVMARLEKNQRVPPRPFNELYVEKFKNVSILYADIVNSMLLAAKLTPNELVETLNELFGRFDETAEKNNCLRIKLLGDCYYCVSGVPSFDPNHALNCVKMGLEMIRIIRTVREVRQVDVNMRIGIHSGMVLSGLLGLHKWQYDIWSRDSMTASAMEHHGIPGLVHVTRTTFKLLPDASLSQFYIQERKNDEGETTYLIDKRNSNHLRTFSFGSPCSRKRGQSEKLKTNVHKLRRSSSFDSIYFSHKRTILEASLRRYREMVRLVNEVLETDIDEMPLSKKSQWLHPQGINPLFLNFTEKLSSKVKDKVWLLERRFATQPDPLFRYYLYCAGIICLAIILIKVTIPKMVISAKLQWSLAASMVLITASLIFTYSKPEKLRYGLRLALWFTISLSLMVCSTIDIVTDDCLEDRDQQKLVNCAFTWYYTFCLILSMTSVSLFIRINLWLKFMFHLSACLAFISLSKKECSVLTILDRRVKWKFLGYAPHVGHLYYIITVAILLHVIDRQIEYMLRLDFQWNTRLEIERKEAFRVGDINRILLENILPIHVAERYLYSSSVNDTLYSESYDSIAVMFASIPNYIDFYTETNINEEGLKCLQLLNEIICDFDQVLAQSSFARIEKIKTIGSTYMAASGLQPGRGSTGSEVSVEDVATNVIALVRFAMSLMETINKINKDALQDFKVRVGISVGPVIAGVVGAIKPQYDIWGDTVNVASRMESTGISGRIQITEQVAEILNSACLESIALECRGPVMVKGKGELITYLVVTPFDSDHEEVTNM